MSLPRKAYLPALLSGLLGVAVFAISLRATYIFDDNGVLQEDRRIQDPHLWHLFLTQSYNRSVDNLYRPLVSMSFALEWYLHGDRAWIFHLVNLLLHGAVCASVAEFTRRALGFREAMIAGLLFAVHPVHSEAIISIANRSEMMCALGIFGALTVFQGRLTGRRILIIVLCLLLALLSKEQGMLLPLLLLIFYLSQRLFPNPLKPVEPVDPAQRQRGLLLVAVLCLCLSGYIVWRETHLRFWWDRSFMDWTINPMVQSKNNPHGGAIGIDRGLVPLTILGHYTKLLVAPTTLSIEYGSTIIGWTARMNDPYFWLGCLSMALWIALVIVAVVRRSAGAIFALLAMGVTYGMVSNAIVLIGTIFGERLIYIPSAFFLILLAMAVSRVPNRVLGPILGAALLLGTIRSVIYASRWDDRLKFYSLAVADQPQSIRIRIALAAELRERGNYLEAEKVTAESRKILPEYCDVWLQSGQVALDLYKFDEARRFFDQAVAIEISSHTVDWFIILAQKEAEYRAATTTRAAE